MAWLNSSCLDGRRVGGGMRLWGGGGVSNTLLSSVLCFFFFPLRLCLLWDDCSEDEAVICFPTSFRNMMSRGWCCPTSKGVSQDSGRTQMVTTYRPCGRNITFGQEHDLTASRWWCLRRHFPPSLLRWKGGKREDSRDDNATKSWIYI